MGRAIGADTHRNVRFYQPVQNVGDTRDGLQFPPKDLELALINVLNPVGAEIKAVLFFKADAEKGQLAALDNGERLLRRDRQPDLDTWPRR